MSSVVLRQKKKDSAVGDNTHHCFDYGRPFSADGGTYSTIASRRSRSVKWKGKHAP